MALVGPVFFDTSVFVSGLLGLGAPAGAAEKLLRSAADGRLRRVRTAWHCCLEFFAVVTRLPEEYRLAPADAVRLIRDDILAHFDVLQLPAAERPLFLDEAARERVAGGRIYDAHLARIARRAGVKTVVTENLRHFLAMERFSIAVLDSASCASLLA